MKQQVVSIYKPIGKTPLEMVELFKERNLEYVASIISYAGRLDPMAHGLLILLIGDENKQREKYLHLDKTYEVEILFGFATDTYDILGKVTEAHASVILSEAKDLISTRDSSASLRMTITREEIEKELQKFVGKREQEYPPYSSKAVGGKPLFWWARENRLGEIEIPKKEVEIFSIAVLSERGVRGKELLGDIEERITKVCGNFRQDEILNDWRKTIDVAQSYFLVKIQVVCSSGTYMRSLAHELGERLGIGAIAYDIYRTKVGVFSQNTIEDWRSDLSRKLL